jgi:hypothetical protein
VRLRAQPFGRPRQTWSKEIILTSHSDVHIRLSSTFQYPPALGTARIDDRRVTWKNPALSLCVIGQIEPTLSGGSSLMRPSRRAVTSGDHEEAELPAYSSVSASWLFNQLSLHCLGTHFVWVPPAPTVADYLSSSHASCFFCAQVFCYCCFLGSILSIVLSSIHCIVCYIRLFLRCDSSFSCCCCCLCFSMKSVPLCSAQVPVTPVLHFALGAGLSAHRVASIFFLVAFPVAVDPLFFAKLSFSSAPFPAERFL